MDVKKNIDFEQYYENEYNNVIAHYYKNIKDEKMFAIILRIIVGVILIVILTMIDKKINLKEPLNNYYIWIISAYYTLIVVGTIISIINHLKKQIYKINEYIIKDMVAFVTNNDLDDVTYESKLQISEDSIEKMGLFNLDVVKYNGKNYINAQYNKNSMAFSDINTYVFDVSKTEKIIYKNGKKYLRTITRRKKRYIFKGIYIGATLNKKNKNQIYLIPNNFNDRFLQSKIMNYIKYHGTNIMLENLEFSKKYKVFCDDEVQARYILSLGLMEKINKLDELFKGKKYIVFKEGRRFSICIEGVSIEELRKSKMPMFRNIKKEKVVLMNFFCKINDLFKIYHILDLGNDLYVNHLENPAKKDSNINDKNTRALNIQGALVQSTSSKRVLNKNEKDLNTRNNANENILKIRRNSMDGLGLFNFTLDIIKKEYNDNGINPNLTKLLNDFSKNLIKQDKQDQFWSIMARGMLETLIILNLAENNVNLTILLEQSGDINKARQICRVNMSKLDISKLQNEAKIKNSIKTLNGENNDKTLASILKIVYEALLPYDRSTVDKGDLKTDKETHECENKSQKEQPKSNSIMITCPICNNEFKIRNVPVSVKTFYCNCPNCKTHLKRGNPFYKELSRNDYKKISFKIESGPALKSKDNYKCVILVDDKIKIDWKGVEKITNNPALINIIRIIILKYSKGLIDLSKRQKEHNGEFLHSRKGCKDDCSGTIKDVSFSVSNRFDNEELNNFYNNLKRELFSVIETYINLENKK